MNERQPYEKYLSEKLSNLPPPASAHQSWEQMRELLDKELPRGGSGGSGGNGRWWIFGSMTALIFLGTWLTGKQFGSHHQDQPLAGKTTDSTLKSFSGSPPESNFAYTSRDSNSRDNNQNFVSQNNQNTNASEKTFTKPTADETILHKSNATSAPVETKYSDNTGAIPEIKAERKPASNSVIAVKDKDDVVPRVVPSHPDRSSRSKPGSTSSRRRRTRIADTNVASGATVHRNNIINHNNKTSSASLSHNLKKQTTNNHLAVVKKSTGSKVIKPNRLPLHGLDSTATTQAVHLLTSTSVAAPQTFLEEYNSPATLIEDSLMNMYEAYVYNQFPINAATNQESEKKHNKTTSDGPGTFVAGITLPLNIPINDQQAFGLNRNGNPSTLSDYLPNIHLQYRFHARAYLQAEIQFSAPQFISPLLMYQQKEQRQLNSYTYTSIYARKLYYFNLPLTLHYNVVPGLYFGAGLQYSSLQSGIALSEKTQIWNGNPPREMTKYYYSKFKKDSLSNSLKSHEFRLVVDFNYYINRFTVGMRYNQALSNYADFRVGNTPFYVRDKNKSLQFYVRYNVWENRKGNNRIKKGNAQNLLTFK